MVFDVEIAAQPVAVPRSSPRGIDIPEGKVYDFGDPESSSEGHLRNSIMRAFALVLLIAAVMSVSASAQGKPGIEGVWQLTEITVTGGGGMTMRVTQPSVYIFAKTHYSKMYVASDRPVLDDYSKATQEQLLSIFVNGFDASAGTYEVKADKLTLHSIVAKSPTDMKEGAWSTYSMKISGDTITLTPENSDAGPPKKLVTFKLTRVE